MIKYQIVRCPTWDDLIDILQEMGEEGWRVVHIADERPGKIVAILWRKKYWNDA